MNELMLTFNSAEFGSVRGFMVNDEPYFAGKDVAEILGYKDTSDALKRHVDEEDKGVGELPTPGGTQKFITINESGLYSLILSSKLPSAKRFKRWVTAEVLPSLRKDGMYISREVQQQLISSIELINKNMALLSDRIELLENRDAAAVPGAKSPYDIILDSIKYPISISVIASHYGLSSRKLNAILAELGIQFKKGNAWFPCEPYKNVGYMHMMTYENNDGVWNVNTKWTRSGCEFIRAMLKDKRGILPLCEVN